MSASPESQRRRPFPRQLLPGETIIFLPDGALSALRGSRTIHLPREKRKLDDMTDHQVESDAIVSNQGEELRSAQDRARALGGVAGHFEAVKESVQLLQLGVEAVVQKHELVLSGVQEAFKTACDQRGDLVSADSGTRIRAIRDIVDNVAALQVATDAIVTVQSELLTRLLKTADVKTGAAEGKATERAASSHDEVYHGEEDKAGEEED